MIENKYHYGNITHIIDVRLNFEMSSYCNNLLNKWCSG